MFCIFTRFPVLFLYISKHFALPHLASEMFSPNLIFLPVCRTLWGRIFSAAGSLTIHSYAKEERLLAPPPLSHAFVRQYSSLAPEKTPVEASNNAQPEVDKLFEKINAEVRGHDFTVLKSYTLFVKNVCRALDIEFSSAHGFMINTNHSKSNRPKYLHWIQPMLRSKFAKKKYQLHYETRTYVMEFDVHHLTGSTASAFLEYIERNIPEGVALRLTYTEMCFLPETIVKTMAKATNNA